MAGSLDKLVAPGRHMRRPGRGRAAAGWAWRAAGGGGPRAGPGPGGAGPGLRRVCLAALMMLVVQYGLGIFLNLYVAVPASDAQAGIFGEIATAPLALTVHPP